MKWLPCPMCGDDRTYVDQPSGPQECGCCGELQAVVRADGVNAVVEVAPVRRQRPPPAASPRSSRPRGRRARVAWERSRASGGPR